MNIISLQVRDIRQVNQNKSSSFTDMKWRTCLSFQPNRRGEKYRALAISGYICASKLSSVRKCSLLVELDEPYF